MMKERKKMKKILLAGLLAGSMLAAGCQATTSQSSADKKIDDILARAANQAAATGQTKETLALLEKIYRRHSDDPEVAMRYAGALRNAGYLSRASIIVTPFSEGRGGVDVHPPAVMEHASILAAMGEYTEAEDKARKAVTMMPEQGKPYHVLGIVLDAQGFHEQAEVAFNKALDRWEGDPSPVLNNLGLNLAAQGFLDRAVETLRKARALAPEREEIERNLRIVSALQTRPPESGTRLIPYPPEIPPRKYEEEEVKREAREEAEAQEALKKLEAQAAKAAQTKPAAAGETSDKAATIEVESEAVGAPSTEELAE